MLQKLVFFSTSPTGWCGLSVVMVGLLSKLCSSSYNGWRVEIANMKKIGGLGPSPCLAGWV